MRKLAAIARREVRAKLTWREPVQTCPCGSAKLRRLDYVRAALGEGAVHSLVSGCGSCGLVFLNPPPSAAELAANYGPGGQWQEKLSKRARSGYKSSRDPVAPIAETEVPEETFPSVARELREQHGPGRVLDFGCGDGSLLDTLQDEGWETTGIDPTPHQITRHTMLDAMPETPTYDLIVMRHVLEHLTDPLATLRAARAAILEGGHLLVGVPRLDGLSEHRKKRYCLNMLHVTAYTERSLRNLLALAGFATVRRLELRKAYRLALLARANGRTSTVRDPLRDARREFRRESIRELGRWQGRFTSIEERAALQSGRR